MEKWVRETQSETIDLNDEGLDLDEVFEDDEEDHKDRGKNRKVDQEEQTMWQLDWVE